MNTVTSTKTFLNEIPYAEFEKIVANNSELMSRAYERAEEDAYFCVDEVLTCMYAPKLMDYSIGSCNHNYVSFDRCNDNDTLIYCKEIDRIYGVFYDDKQLITALEDAIDRRDEIENPYYYTDEELEIEHEIEILKGALAEILKNYLKSYYDIDQSYAISAAYDTELFDDIYIQDDKLYRRHEDEELGNI